MGAALAATAVVVVIKKGSIFKHSPGDGEVEREFKSFIRRFQKDYTPDEKKHRFEIFKANYLFIISENAKGHSYQLGVNEFADLTSNEFTATHLGLKTDTPKKIWGDLPTLGQYEYSGGDLPASVDWTKKGAVTPVKNQGQCGSCWAFSTTGALEGAHEIATGDLVSLSEQQFVDCAGAYGNAGCNGGLMDNAFLYAEKNAICTEASYKYTGLDGTCKASSCTVGLPKGTVTGIWLVKPDSTESLMAAVAQQPVSIAIEADKMVFQLYKSGVLSATCGTMLDHGVLAVGYGTNSATSQEYWLVKNSWGTSWGEEGYIKLLRDKKSVAAGECGLKTEPSFPDVSTKPGKPPSPAAPSLLTV